MTDFGEFVRLKREMLRKNDRNFSQRQVALRIGVEPAYLSEDPDLLLALAGKVSSDLQEIIRRRPMLFAELLRELKNAPDHAVVRVVREVRDGNW